MYGASSAGTTAFHPIIGIIIVIIIVVVIM